MGRPGSAVTCGRVAAAVCGYLCLRTFVFPATPVLLASDQSFFWMYGERMLRGEHVYRDFFQFTPPGTDLVYLAAFAAFGPRIWVTNAVVVGLGTALGAACFRVARRILEPALAALATALFVVLVYGQPLSATHHWFSMLAVMSAIEWLGPEASRRRLVAAGATLGLASFFTQTHGAAALAGAVAFVGWRAHEERLAPRFWASRLALLVGSFSLTWLALTGYFAVTVGARKLASVLVSYVWGYMGYSPLSADLGLPEAPRWRSLRWLAPYLLVYAIVPTAYVLGAASYRRARRAGEPVGGRTTVALLWLVGVALLIEVAAGLSWLRIFAVSMPAIILLVWVLDRAGRWKGPLKAIAWSGTACLAAGLIRSTYRHHTLVLDFPAGRAATDALNRDKLFWFGARVPPGGALFAADRPNVYLPLGLHNPLYLDAAVPTRQTRIESVQLAIAQIEATRLQYVLWSPALENCAGGPEMAGMVALRAYVHERYHPVRAFSDGDEAWERR
jgi:hypothetical protein